MKKNYLFILLCSVSICLYSQKTLDIGPSWNEVTNWSDDTYPVSTDVIQISSIAAASTLDRDTDAERLQTGTTTNDYSIAEDVAPKLLTLHKSFSGTSYWDEAATVIYNQGAGTSMLTLNNDFYLDNDQVGYVTIKNFIVANTLSVGATCSIVFNTPTVINNRGTVNIYGTLSSTEAVLGVPDHRFIFSQAGVVNFLGTAIVSADGVYLYNLSDVVMSTDASHVVTEDEIAVNGGATANLTINTEDCIQGKIRLNNGSTFNFNINANLNSLGTLNMSSSVSTINMTIDDSVTAIHFANSSSQGTNVADDFSIVGFKENVLRFGTDATGLTTAQLERITADGVASGMSLELDTDGYLVVAAAASIDGNDSIDSFVLSPNPVKDQLNIHGMESIEKIEIYNSVGGLLKSVENFDQSIDVSDLSSGVYTLKVYSTSGEIKRKFIKN